MDNTQDEIEKLNREIIEKDSAIAKLEAECREINIERLQVKTDKYWSEFELQSEIERLNKEIIEKDSAIAKLKAELQDTVSEYLDYKLVGEMSRQKADKTIVRLETTNVLLQDELATRNKEIEILKQELNTFRGVDGAGRLNTRNRRETW